MTENALVPVDQKQVVFYDDEITAVLVQIGSDEKVYVPIRPICDFLGVSWTGQRRRINRDAVLSGEVRSVNVTFTEPARTRQISMLCLPLDFVSGFLFGINPDRTKPEIKEKLVRYQRECYKVLAEAFREGRLTADPGFDELLAGDTPAAQAYKMAAAIMKMARQQLILESQLESHTVKLIDHEQRLEEIEATLGDTGRSVTPDQAMQISQAIKAIATEIQKRTKKNEYGAIYGQLYREFGVTSYKLLPANKFDQAMAWLTNWYRRLTGSTGGELPF
jgi:hypothetical protein